MIARRYEGLEMSRRGIFGARDFPTLGCACSLQEAKSQPYKPKPESAPFIEVTKKLGRHETI